MHYLITMRICVKALFEIYRRARECGAPSPMFSLQSPEEAEAFYIDSMVPKAPILLQA